jgi:hypothetical protein
MRILICAVPPHKITDTASKVECDHLRIIGSKDTLKCWQRMPSADLCIVVSTQVSAQGLHHVKRVFGKQFVAAPSLNEAIRIANDAAAADEKKRA